MEIRLQKNEGGPLETFKNFRQNFFDRGEAVLRKHLRRNLRTFEENQISNIIRRTKGKIENHSSPTGTSKKPSFLNRNPLKNRKLRKIVFEVFRQNFSKKVSGKSLSARKPSCSQNVSFLVKIEGGSMKTN